MNNATRFPHLLNAPILADLPREVANQILNAATTRSYDRSHPVLTQGAEVSGMFILAHGAIEITSRNVNEQTVLIHLCRPGEIFGDVEALAEMPAAANCIAVEQSVVLSCPTPLLHDCMANQIFQRNLMRVCFERLSRDNAHKFVDAFYPVEQRLCDYLHRLSVGQPEIAKTQASLAGLLGCARQTLNRELKRLRERNIIEIEKGKIRVTDRAALGRLAANGYDCSS